MTSNRLLGGTSEPRAAFLIVDDDPASLQALERCLRWKYGAHFQLLSTTSGAAALHRMQELKRQDTAVALIAVQQLLRDIPAAGLLQQASELFPHARRILYATSEEMARETTADRSDQQTGDSYLVRPWDEPETRLYPTLDDLLKDWRAAAEPPSAELRVVGDRWSPMTHNAKDFLARNRIPYRWLDIERGSEAGKLLEQIGVGRRKLPVLVFPDGSYLISPADEAIAAKIGFSTEAEEPFYDLIIAGGGPAGLAAAVYGSSEGLRTLIIEVEAPGGQAGMSAAIENYLGFPEGLSGADLAKRAVEQARRFGVEILAAREATGMRTVDHYRLVELDDGSELACYAVLIATGVAYRTLDVSGAAQLNGKGVYYGAASAEAQACENQEVYLVGGGNSAGQAVLHIARYAKQVTIITVDDSLEGTMSQYLFERIDELENVSVRPHSTVTHVQGEQRVEAIEIKDVRSEQRETVPTTALFVWIGGSPRSDWLAGVLERDEQGFVRTGPQLDENDRPPQGWPLKRRPFLLESSIPGVFVAGDVRAGSVKRIAAAVGEGAMAIQFIQQYLSKM